MSEENEIVFLWLLQLKNYYNPYGLLFCDLMLFPSFLCCNLGYHNCACNPSWFRKVWRDGMYNIRVIYQINTHNVEEVHVIRAYISRVELFLASLNNVETKICTIYLILQVFLSKYTRELPMDISVDYTGPLKIVLCEKCYNIIKDRALIY